jgi:hypothetical protein
MLRKRKTFCQGTFDMTSQLLQFNGYFHPTHTIHLCPKLPNNKINLFSSKRTHFGIILKYWLNLFGLTLAIFKKKCGSHKLQRKIIILWKHIAFQHIYKQPNDWIKNIKSSLPSYFLFHYDFIMKFVPYQYRPLVHVAYLWCTCWISFYWKVCTLH